MDKKKIPIFKVSIIVLFILFIALYIAGNSGYYDYEAGKKARLTAEKMQEFEQDVKDGKNIDLTNYLDETEKDYRTGLGNVCFKVTEQINKYTKKGVESILKFVIKAVEQ